MARPVVIIGIGEIGTVLAGGFLRLGYPIIPVLRGVDPGRWAGPLPRPELAVVAVGEQDLHPALESLPDTWGEHLGLIQNELLPGDWERHGIKDPTVASIWFEKKPGRPVKPILPTPVHGPGAELLAGALTALDLPARIVTEADEMTEELVRKNLYILVSNICGLVVGGTTGELWTEHRDLAEEVAADVLDIQESLVGRPLSRERLLAGTGGAFTADPDHGNRGRSAPERLRRALAHADAAGLTVPALRRIAASA